MPSKTVITKFNEFKNKINKLDIDSNEYDVMNDKFFRTFSREEIYKMLINKYINKKEVSDVIFQNYGKEKGFNDVKDQGDLEDNFNFDDYYDDEDGICYPKIWQFRTDKSKAYEEFISDIHFLKNRGILLNYEIEVGLSNKKHYECDKLGYKYDANGTKTKNAVTIILTDREQWEYE